MSRFELDAAKASLRLPELWRILNLPGESPARDGVKFSSPFRLDLHPSCSFYHDCRKMRDWSTGEDYDAIAFLQKVQGIKNGEAIRRFIELANGHRLAIENAPIIRVAQPKAKAKRPVLLGLRKAARAELQQIADSRRIDVRAVDLAQDLGTLRVAEVCGYLSWVLFDESGFCAEGRRLNRKPYSAIGKLGERKAHTLRGSQKNWPVGILPTKEYRQCVEAFLLVEGGPDYLAALHFALQQNRTGILPVAMLGRGVGVRGLHPESLKHFRGRRVRIYPHNDRGGGAYQNTYILGKQLEKLDCEVDCFCFDGLHKADGGPIKDLNDCVELAAEYASRLEELLPRA